MSNLAGLLSLCRRFDSGTNVRTNVRTYATKTSEKSLRYQPRGARVSYLLARLGITR